MKILVTGGGGYIGEHVLDSLFSANLSNKTRVLVYQDDSIKQMETLSKKYGFEIVKGNILNENEVDNAVDKCTHIIHLAGLVGSGDKKKNINVNLNGTINIINACRKNKVKHIIFTSTVSAIRSKTGPYGTSKKLAEKEIVKSGVPYTIFRPTMVYGTRSQGLSRIIQNIRRFPLFIPLIGTGSYLRQPIYVKDLAKLIVMSLQKKQAINKIYNAGGNRRIKFKNLVKKVALEMKIKKIFVPVPIFLCNALGFIFEKIMKKPFFTREHIRSLSEDTVMDIEPIKNDFGFKFTDLDTGLNETISQMS